VWDVGTGTATLAIWAARAGATSVRSCEREHWVSVMAAATVGVSGVSEKVSVVHQPDGCAAVAGGRRSLHVCVSV